VNWPGPNP